MRRKTQRGTWRLGNLSTPKSVQKLQTALHAKAKAEAGYRFYALYDKISREDILAHAYAQCRSNKGAPGVDGQDFADIEAYGVERWLGGVVGSPPRNRGLPRLRILILRKSGVPDLRRGRPGRWLATRLAKIFLFLPPPRRRGFYGRSSTQNNLLVMRQGLLTRKV